MGRTPRQIEDERLALRCRRGEPGAFGELVATMERRLLYFARSIVGSDEAALDVLQAVWMTAFRDLRRLDDPAALRAWLYQVTRGHAVNHVRRDAVRASAQRSLAESADDAEPTPKTPPRSTAPSARSTLGTARCSSCTSSRRCRSTRSPRSSAEFLRFF